MIGVLFFRNKRKNNISFIPPLASWGGGFFRPRAFVGAAVPPEARGGPAAAWLGGEGGERGRLGSLKVGEAGSRESSWAWNLLQNARTGGSFRGGHLNGPSSRRCSVAVGVRSWLGILCGFSSESIAFPEQGKAPSTWQPSARWSSTSIAVRCT